MCQCCEGASSCLFLVPKPLFSTQTDAPDAVLWDIMKCWAKLHPPAKKRMLPGAVCAAILAREPAIEVTQPICACFYQSFLTRSFSHRLISTRCRSFPSGIVLSAILPTLRSFGARNRAQGVQFLLSNCFWDSIIFPLAEEKGNQQLKQIHWTRSAQKQIQISCN